MQILLQPFAGSIHEYDEEIADPSRYRPDHCPQCQATQGLTAHGLYRRTLVDAGFDGSIRVRRYLCRFRRRTVERALSGKERCTGADRPAVAGLRSGGAQLRAKVGDHLIGRFCRCGVDNHFVGRFWPPFAPTLRAAPPGSRRL